MSTKSHAEGMIDNKDGEILFDTRFDYFFPEAARSPGCLLEHTPQTVAGLKALGTAMATDVLSTPETNESKIPAIYTYFGQIIDHDTTARTDRNGTVTMIGDSMCTPASPDKIIAELKNGRTPCFDLDSLFGYGPGLAGRSPEYGVAKGSSQTQHYHEADLSLKMVTGNGRRDVPRKKGGAADIPDERNGENLNLNQLHGMMMLFFNKILSDPCGLKPEDPAQLRFVRARQLTRWAFQYVVLHDYLPQVCDPAIVADVVANGPRFLGASAGRIGQFMPLEYSAAGFRFAHSMIRPQYQMNKGVPPQDIMHLIDFSNTLTPGGGSSRLYMDTTQPAKDPQDAFYQLKPDFVIDWEYYKRNGKHVQFARKIDPQLANGLGSLPFSTRKDDPVLGHLARANLLRGFNLSIPTAQAMTDGFGITCLSAQEIQKASGGDLCDVLEQHGFLQRTPLWFYILLEAKVQNSGERLGELGSRIVAETIVSFIQNDPNSYLYGHKDKACHADAIKVLNSGGEVNDVNDIIRIAEM